MFSTRVWKVVAALALVGVGVGGTASVANAQSGLIGGQPNGTMTMVGPATPTFTSATCTRGSLTVSPSAAVQRGYSAQSVRYRIRLQASNGYDYTFGFGEWTRVNDPTLSYNWARLPAKSFTATPWLTWYVSVQYQWYVGPGISQSSWQYADMPCRT